MKHAALFLEGRQPQDLDLGKVLLSIGFEVAKCPPTNLRRHFQTQNPSLAIVGSWEEAAWRGVELAKEIRRIDKQIPIILLTASSSEKLAVSALKAGISDYFTPPYSSQKLVEAFNRCLADLSADRVDRGKPTIPGRSQSRQLIGVSQMIETIRAYLPRVAVQDSNVLITGETGTGKEVVAEMIHRQSRRHRHPFVRINCAAIPDDLFESELYGYERGAFTGAISSKPGKLELADGGTVFLDEIGDMGLHAQAKLLRTIETKEVCRLGGNKVILLDFRVIAATNRQLEQLMAAGKFRQDLYFRLNVGRIYLSPLRERKEDLQPLLDHYLLQMNRKFGCAVQGFTAEARASLVSYDWPGNVRELINVLEATFINLPSHKITLADLPGPFQRHLKETEGLPVSERERLLAALYATNWNKTKAAESLKWSRVTVYRKMSKYHLLKDVDS